MTNKSIKIKEFLAKTIESHNILEYAKNLGYSDENILVLKGDEETLFRLFPETRSHLEGCVHNRDMRSMFEYAEDLVYSWLMEDYLFNILQQKFKIEHYGGDKERFIKPSAGITNQSDLLIYDTQRIPVSFEIINDYTGLFTNKKICNLRDQKFQRLKSNSLKQKTHIFGLDIINQKFFIIDVERFDSIKRIYSHPPFGGKPAVELNLSNTEFFDFTKENVLKIVKFFINK